MYSCGATGNERIDAHRGGERETPPEFKRAQAIGWQNAVPSSDAHRTLVVAPVTNTRIVVLLLPARPGGVAQELTFSPPGDKTEIVSEYVR
jgi:hypothetical protein